MSTVLFGSIGTIAETSEMQRKAYNDAFAEHGLGWTWEPAEYRRLLPRSGGRDRVADYADERGETVDADAVHRTKSRLYQQALAQAPVEARPGVVDTITRAKADGLKLALVTTTSPENIEALTSAITGVERSDFDVIVDVTKVDTPKPDKAPYVWALEQLGEQPGDCVAVEDNAHGVQAATAAGVPVIAFPGANTADHDFGDVPRVQRIELSTLHELILA